MIVYFSDRQFNILGQASTELPDGLTITNDLKTEDVETGISTFECDLPFTQKDRAAVVEYTAPGNYILRSSNNENELYTIIDREIDTKKQKVMVYAEDDGLDLLNEIVGAYEAPEAYPISHYIELYASNAGFTIGINEAASLTRKLSWDGEATAAERVASVATQFDGCEISYSFVVDGLFVTAKHINIYKQRGKDVGATLRLNEDIDSIITKESIANIATALKCTGGTPEAITDEETGEVTNPPAITLAGYEYDDGDFYVDGDILKSRKALAKWSRLLWRTDGTTQAGGHITKLYSYDTLEQSTLCSHAITELKKLRDIEVNYEVEISKLPENIKIGDRVNIVDDAGELYLSARILLLERSEAEGTQTATLGEYLIKGSGIAQRIADLAERFAKEAEANRKAREEAAKKAEEARKEAEEAAKKAEEAQNNLNGAYDAAQEAQRLAEEAQAKVEEAERAAAEAAQQAADAKANVTIAQGAAENATTKAQEAQAKAEEAHTAATDAKTTADAAKLDAEKANSDILNLGNNLETVTRTMEADYARKTELTEAEAALQTQISQNAAQISSTASRVQTIDETVNDAKDKADAAQTAAGAAKETANQASAEAQAAQTAANNAAQAAANAQSQADTAQAAANAAQQAADDADAKAVEAEAKLAVAQENLTEVTNRVDATEEEVEAAKQAVEVAKKAADDAKEEATAAQASADAAKADAKTAQDAADNAKTAADAAQATADAAQDAADRAQAAVDALAVRVTTAETTITQNSEEIALRATKTEVIETLGGYSSKEETSAEIQTTADEIVMSALTDYVKNDDLTEYKGEMSSQFKQLSGSIDMIFESDTTQRIDGELQELKETIYKHFSFTGNGLTITAGENSMNLTLDNDKIIFTQNGQQIGLWDGSNFYTGNIYVETEKRAQFGNFAFVPRSNGSMDFLKVGG